MDNWKGSVVEESLSDNRVMNGTPVLKVTITNEALYELRWHIYTVSVTDEGIDLLDLFLKEKWYMHFWKGNDLLVLFKGKRFKMKVNNKKSHKEAIDYGLSVGISREQLEFVCD